MHGFADVNPVVEHLVQRAFDQLAVPIADIFQGELPDELGARAGTAGRRRAWTPSRPFPDGLKARKSGFSAFSLESRRQCS